MVVVAGGIGLAPLRPALLQVLAARELFGRVSLLYGGRTPADLLFESELTRWSATGLLDLAVTVDRASSAWTGPVGLVTELVPAATFDPPRSLVLVCGPEVMMRYVAAALIHRGVPAGRIRLSMERNMQCGVGLCGHCQLREHLVCVDGPVFALPSVGSSSPGAGAVMAAGRRPKLAVWKFASCDGCQLTLLNCEDELLHLAGEIEIAYFPEATRAVTPGPYDLSLVEGSVTTPDDAERIRQVRRDSRRLVTIGACATAGGVQALRNFGDVEEFRSVVYAQPDYVRTLDRSTPIASHVPVDFELRGCPIDRTQLLEVISAFLQRRKPRVTSESVCVECKRRGNVCVTVAHGTPCLGPVTHAGCGALCPSVSRGCYGCFGPADTTNTASLTGMLVDLGMPRREVQRVYRTFNAAAPAFAGESARLAGEDGGEP